jgi:hypothetical protein
MVPPLYYWNEHHFKNHFTNFIHSLVDLDDVGANAGTKTTEANRKGK